MDLEIHFVDQPVDSRLTMLELNLAQYQSRRIAGVPAAEIDLHTDQFMCPCNGRSR